MARLEIDGLRKTFGRGEDRIEAVSDLSLSAADGEFLVLVGPSGCGKSTTLNCVAGLESVTDGEIRIDGEVVNDRRPEDRDIAMVFQNYALYPHMTAAENMAFGLKMTTGLSAAERRDRVESTAELLDIGELLEKKPRSLSGGQKQRVALGRAIVRDPAVFLMDEPLSNLDASLRSTMRTEIQQLQDDLGVTTVYVTHDQTEAMTMADRIAILREGELQQIGEPLDCYYRPKNEFVAGFIGEPAMNTVRVTRRGDTLVGDALEYPVPRRADGLPSGEPFTLGIRPEAIEIVEAGTGAATGTVEVVEPLGETSHAYLTVADATVTVTTDGPGAVEEGERVGIDFPAQRVHLFDPDTGAAVARRESLPGEVTEEYPASRHD
ncbi:multiple sugar transport system ATP-binding protein [Halobiforma haloterrestris]|uniref:ABC-type D-xylose/L-arabinose transporter n=1 Tax=Natronobacterium haloterrestre TaxID=148448 RepID=A0A1I1DBK6_NATHA|nr:sn-glycerol-3-phosphate ABC transporter ATP-binding protein UgpC [Halobiforma haloterrestris]SFB72311.1 multiple sugar transport system ATP-binding protein [Halobiforma haloterrestris]